MTELARYMQLHPYQVLYALLPLCGLLVINEMRHAWEKRTLRRALLRPAAAIPAVATPPAPVPPPKAASGVGAVLGTLLVIGAAIYVWPLLQGQLGPSAGAAPVSQALSSGTYRGLASGAFGSANITLHLNLLSEPETVQIETPAGTYGLRGEIRPQTDGTFVSGQLVDGNGLAFGSLKAHVTATQVSGTIGAGPLQGTLDLRR